MMDDSVISALSEIRSEYNLFDPKDEPRYRALSTAIEALNVVTCECCRYSEGEPISDGRLWCDYLKTYMRYCSEGDRRS